MHLRLRPDHKRRTALTAIDRPSRHNKDEERGRLTLEISGEKRYCLNAAPLASNSVRRQEYRQRIAFLTRFLVEVVVMQFGVRRALACRIARQTEEFALKRHHYQAP